MSELEPIQARTPNRRRAKLLVRLVGPLLLIIVLYRIRREKDAIGALLSADILPLLAALLLNILNNWLKVLRWDVLLAARGHHYDRKRAWTSFLSSVYVGMLTPGRVGDVLRAQYLKHDLGIPYAEGIAVIVVDRLCDLYVLIAFVALGIARFSSVLVGRLALLTWVLVLLTALGPLLLFIPGVAQRTMRALYRKLPGDPTGAAFDRFLAALKTQRLHHLIQAVVLTTLAFSVNYLQGYLLAGAMHIDLAFYDVVCLLAIASLLGLLPISISGIGVRELFFSLVFPVLGHSPASGVVYGIGIFLVIYVAVVLMGLVSWHIAPPPLEADNGQSGKK